MTIAAASTPTSVPALRAVAPELRTTGGLGDSARRVLERRLYAVLQTENDDGSAHLVPVMFLFEDGRIMIETAAATRKCRNVTARSRASVLVQTPEASWVWGAGPARVVTGIEAQHRNDRIRARYLTDAGQRACGDLLTELDDVTIVVEPTRWLGWDLTAFMETLAGRGVDLDGVDEWFREDG